MGSIVFNRLKTIIAEQFTVGADTIFEDTSFVDDLGADSLDAVDITMAICSEFDIAESEEEQVMSFVTVGELAQYLSANYD